MPRCLFQFSQYYRSTEVASRKRGQYTLKQAVRHEPRDKQHKVGREAQEEEAEGREEEDGVDNGDAGDDYGVDDAAVGAGLVDAEEVAEAAEDGEDDDGAGQLAEAEEDGDDLVGGAGLGHCRGLVGGMLGSCCGAG